MHLNHLGTWASEAPERLDRQHTLYSMKPFLNLVAGMASALLFVSSSVAGEETPATSMQRHHVLTFETYRLQQGALEALQDADLPSQALFDKVREFAEKGGASLESLVAVAATPVQRATSESIDELIYPTASDPPQIGQPFAFPTCFEMRPLGERIELETDTDGEGAPVKLEVAPEFVRLRGFTVQVADRSSDGDVQPLITCRKMHTKVICPLDRPVLLGSMNTPANTGIPETDGDGTMSLSFVRVRQAEPRVSDTTLPTKEAIPSGKNLRLVFRCYSLPRADARDLLAATTDGDRLLQLIRERPAESLKLERMITMMATEGMRVTYEEVGERIYGTELDPPQIPILPDNDVTVVAVPPAEGVAPAASATPKVKIIHGAGLVPAWFSAFEMRPLGWRIEVEPTLLPGGRLVKLALAPELTEYRGMVKGHPLLERYPEQPVFASQKLTTLVTAAVGHQCFVGTLNRPRDSGVNGRVDDGRTWLAFVKVILE
jgi:hypothetical protein